MEFKDSSYRVAIWAALVLVRIALRIEANALDDVILRRAIGWHAVPWKDAFSDIVRRADLQPQTVLEIGASRRSAPSLFFLRQGASVEVTCYAAEELDGLRRFCASLCEEYKIPHPVIRTHDIFSRSDKNYDLILLKGVLGGLDRKHDMKVFSRALDRCLRMLTENGCVIVIDKGRCSAIHNLLLRRFGAAAKNGWHYFSQRELESSTDKGDDPLVVWKGFLSVGIMPSRTLQWLADLLDTIIFNHFLAHRGTVFAALFKNSSSNDERK